MPAAQPLPAHVTRARIARPDPTGNLFPPVLCASDFPALPVGKTFSELLAAFPI
jgi:hypothetical protein